MERREGTLFGLVWALSEAIDLVSPLLTDHHRRTAWIAVHVAKAMGLDENSCRHILIASLMHDVGAFSLGERLDTLGFEIERSTDHARMGAALLEGFEPFAEESRLIGHHHDEWRSEGLGVAGAAVPVGSRVILLADRAAVLFPRDPDAILERIRGHRGSMFMPEAVDALAGLAGRADFWSGALAPNLPSCLALCRDADSAHVGPEGVSSLAAVFSRVIDYRSRFTATHSAGVAAVAEALARRLGFGEGHVVTIRAAGHLHDLGKLAVPVEVLEKPSRLTLEEYAVVRRHAAHTRRLLEGVADLGLGIKWAYQHHERIDGSGYPDHAAGREIAFGSRVLAVADVLTAVTETRPYRKGMAREEALPVLRRLMEGGRLDPEVGGAASEDFEGIDGARVRAQSAASDGYERCCGTVPV